MRIATLASGSGGNCCLISGGGKSILTDAGISMRRIKAGLEGCGVNIDGISGILITHEHSDHISALPMLLKYYSPKVFAPKTVAAGLCRSVKGLENNINIIPVCEDFEISGFTVRAFHTSHDTEESVGYRIGCGDAVFALATDTGCVTDEIAENLSGADAALIEANHDLEMLKNGPYPYVLKRRILSKRGHLSNSDCALLAGSLAKTGTRHIILGHLSRENNTPALAYKTVHAALEGTCAQLYTAPASETFILDFGEKALCSL